MAFNLEAQLREFSTQTYPTVEQTIVNNASVLHKRKKFFLDDLRHSLKSIGFILLAIIYLRDLSMLRLVIRGFSHFSISNPYPTPSSKITVSDDNKRAISKFLLTSVLVGNVFCMLVHAIFGVYTKSSSFDNYLHGSMTVQFIGERLPYSVLELLLLDLLVFAIQLLFHNVMCVTNDSVLLDQPVPETENSTRKPFNASDGYNGGVFLAAIDVMQNVHQVLNFSVQFHHASLYSAGPSAAAEINGNAQRVPSAPHIPPGAFV